jgi:hypothetical protein
LDINRQPSGTAGGIDKQRNSFLSRDLADVANRFDRSDIVIRMVNANQNGFLSNGSLDLLRIYPAFRIHLYAARTKTLSIQKTDRITNGRMLNFTKNNMIASALICVGNTFDRQISRLRAAGGKYDLLRGLRIYQRSHLVSRLCHRIARAQSVPVKGGRISEGFCEKRPHRLKYLRQHWRARLMIKKY